MPTTFHSERRKETDRQQNTLQSGLNVVQRHLQDTCPRPSMENTKYVVVVAKKERTSGQVTAGVIKAPVIGLCGAMRLPHNTSVKGREVKDIQFARCTALDNEEVCPT
ncbi:unnamed protein product [Ixodes persulcatus]